MLKPYMGKLDTTSNMLPRVYSTDLLGANSTPLPRAFQGETLFSWCARYHRLSGNPTARQTSRQLFGNSLAGLRHDFPSHLDRFQENTNGVLGSPSGVVDNRTIFGFHKSFLDDRRISEAMQTMRTGSGRPVRVILGFAASQLGVAAPLKVCPSCMQEDLQKRHTSWWHIEHQYPAVRVCRRHMQILSIVRDDLHIRSMKDWLLPSDLKPNDFIPMPSINSNGLDHLKRLAEWNDLIVHQRDMKFDRSVLRHVYLLRARDLGWTTMDGSLRFQILRSAFIDAHLGIEKLPGLSFIAKVSDVNGGFIGSLLRQYTGSRHPIKHVLLMAFLFDEPAEFYRQYYEASAVARSKGLAALMAGLKNQQAMLQHMVGNQGQSVNAAAAALGATTTQAIRFLKKSGIKYKERPRILNPELEATLKSLLLAGKEREEIATYLRIRKSFIKDYLAKYSALRSTWERARLEGRIIGYRERFLRLLEGNPGVPLKRIRQIPRNGYQWLNRHDHAWLEDHLPSLWRRN